MGGDSNKLLIIKSGGSDPDAFKESRCLPTNSIEDIANGVGKGFVTVGSGIVGTFQGAFNFVTHNTSSNRNDGKIDLNKSSMTDILAINNTNYYI